MKKESIIEVFLLILVVASITLVPFAIAGIDRYYSSSK